MSGDAPGGESRTSLTLRQGSTGSGFTDLFCAGLTGESVCGDCGHATVLDDVKPRHDDVRLTFTCRDGCGHWFDTYLTREQIAEYLRAGRKESGHDTPAH